MSTIVTASTKRPRARRRSTLLRPQTVMLALLALAPYDGLLLIAKNGSFNGWTVAVLVLAAGMAFLETPARRTRPAPPRWFLPLLLLVAVSLVSVLLHPSLQSVVGFRISYTYLLAPLVLWWCPFTATDRDRLVTILMANGLITSLVGIGQQFVSPEQLHELGYEYNEVIRFSQGVMRSFSTFSQPFPFAYFVMAVLLIGIPVAFEDRGRLRNRLFLLTSPVMVIGLGTAVVRGAILGLVAGLVYLGIRRYRAVGHLLFLLPILLMVVVLSGASDAVFSSSSLDARTTGWVGELGKGLLEPFGEGIGSTGATAELFQTEGQDAAKLLADGGELKRYQADNHYVKMLIELGPVGLWLFVWVVVAAFLDAHKSGAALHSRTERSERGLALGITASIVGAAAAAFVSTYWEVFPADLFFWTSLGVLPSLRDRSS